MILPDWQASPKYEETSASSAGAGRKYAPDVHENWKEREEPMRATAMKI